MLLGVDAIKGSQVIYPVQLRTKANQQWAAMRETQRRIRLALEEHGMLPGDPMRVYGRDRVKGAANSGQDAVHSQDAVHIEESRAEEKPDPTTIKPAEGNPFTGE